MIAHFLGDLRLALRSFARRPGFAALAIATVALGIGANCAIFSVLYATLIKPLPYPEAERLVMVWNKYPLMELPKATVSIPDYLDRREGVRAFEESGLFTIHRLNLADEGAPEHVQAARATASLFRTLRVGAWRGRVFDDGDEIPGQDAVAILSYRLWQRRFGGDPGILGRDVRLDGKPHEVIGILPEGFAFPTRQIEIWRPFAFTPEQTTFAERGNEYCLMLARLGEDATVRQAQRQIDAIHEANKERFPGARRFWDNNGFGGMVVGYREELYGEHRSNFLLLQAAAAFVLLIACANVANLLLTRLNGRRRELAVRTAMGASPWRVSRQLLAEGVVLSVIGSAAGLWLGLVGLDLLRRLGVDATAGKLEIGLDPYLVLFTLGLALTTGVLFSLLPVLAARRTAPNDVLKDSGGRGSSGSGGLQRNLLVVGEVALALLLLVGAGLMIRTMLALQGEDVGFRKDGLFLTGVFLPPERYADDNERIVQFFEQVLERLRSRPGIEHAAVVSRVPFGRDGPALRSYAIQGYETAEGEAEPHGATNLVDEGYFETMGIPLLRGRYLERRDGPGGELVAVIDRRLVEKYFPEEDPLGARISFESSGGRVFRVVGVVDSVKVQNLDQPVVKETIYINYRQAPVAAMTLVLRSDLEPKDLQGAVEEVLGNVDGEVPTAGAITMRRLILESLLDRQVPMVLLAAFGVLAVLLAAVGIYGVLSFSISQRTREIGTRVALGARPVKILALVVGQGAGLTFAGIAAGTLAALALTRSLSSLLYGVPAFDPPTFLAVAAVLLLVSLVACYRPARRALAIDPIEALREE